MSIDFLLIASYHHCRSYYLPGIETYPGGKFVYNDIPLIYLFVLKPFSIVNQLFLEHPKAGYLL